MNVVHEPPYDYFRFTPYALELMLRRANLDIVCIRNQGGGWAMLGQNVAWRTAAAAPFRGGLGARLGVLVAHVAAAPFFLLEHVDKRADWYEALNYLAVARKGF